MGKREHDEHVNLTTLPLLSMRRVCLLADCHPSTVKRSPLVPVGKRGRVLMYRTPDVLAWIAGEMEPQRSGERRRMPARRLPNASASAPTSDALERIREIAKGDAA